MSQRLLLLLMTVGTVATSPAARASGAAPGQLTIRQGAIIDHDTPRDTAEQRAQAAAWRRPSYGAGRRMPTSPAADSGALQITTGKTGAHGADEVVATGHFQCGRLGSPTSGSVCMARSKRSSARSLRFKQSWITGR